MDLTPKGEATLQRMKENMGVKEGEAAFYAKINSGDKEAQTWIVSDKKQSEKKSQTILGGRNLATVRKKQGEGLWQGDIGQ